MAKYPFTQQHDEKDCGAACLSMISEYYGLKLPIAQFRDLIKIDNEGANIYGLTKGADKIGFDTDALEGTSEELLEGISNGEIDFPFVIRIVNEQMFDHFIVVYGIKKGFVIVGDPGKSKITKISFEQFVKQWQGQIVTFLPNQNFEKKNGRKGAFRKFFRYIFSQKKLLLFVFMISIIVSAINISGAIVFEYILSDSFKTTDAQHKEVEYAYIESYTYENGYKDKTEFQQVIEKVENKLFVVFSNINTVCLTVIFMYILRVLLQNIRGYLLAIMAKKMDVSLTFDYYNHLVDLPTSFFATRKTGEFMSRFYDTSKIRDALSTTTLTIMLDTIMTVACGALLCYINTTLFSITLIVMIIYAFIMFLLRKPIKLVNHELMEQEARVISFLKESIDGIETVKAYQYEKMVKRQLDKLYGCFADKNVKGALIYNFQDSMISLVASVGVVVLLWTGTYLCMYNVIDIAELFVFYYLINYFLEPVSNLINLQPELQTAMVAAERLNDILEAEQEEQKSKITEIEGLYGDIKIENLDFRYGNRALVLQDINMYFEKGKKIAIVGESGCGKTTLAKLILSFYRPERGSVMVDGKDLSEYSILSIRKHMAYISQDVFLFSDTIYNNLRFGNEDVTDEEIRNVCKRCYIDEFIKHLPMGYDTMIEEYGTNLSEGQKQRLSIARALLRKPDVLIMDEATSNLDTITEKSVKGVMKGFSEKMTCIIIAHRINTIKNCDYIYVMDKGKIVEQGTHRSLLAQDGMYKQMVICNE